MSYTQTENENRCKAITDQLENYVNRTLYKCPICENTIEWDDSQYYPEESTYTCQVCLETFEENELNAVNIYDYLIDKDIYNYEYRIDGLGKYLSVQIMIACGGPNIYIDTRKQAVTLLWGGDNAESNLSNEVCKEIDNYYKELFETTRRF